MDCLSEALRYHKLLGLLRNLIGGDAFGPGRFLGFGQELFSGALAEFVHVDLAEATFEAARVPRLVVVIHERVLVVQVLLDDLLDFVVEACRVFVVVRVHRLHPGGVLIRGFL